MAIEYEIRHALAGRIRLFVPAIRQVEGFADAVAGLLSMQPGVSGVRINTACASVVIEYDATRLEPGALEQAMAALTPQAAIAAWSAARPSLEADARGDDPAGDDRGADAADGAAPGGMFGALGVSSAALGLALLPSPASLAAVPLLALSAVPIFKRAFRVLREERRLNVDFLDTLAIALSAFRGSLVTGTFMTWLIRLGDAIRDLTAGRSKGAIDKLLEYESRKAWVLEGDRKIEVDVRALKAGDIVLLETGDMVPVDGEVLEGAASVDQAAITGESLPAERGPGERVYAATVVLEGQLRVRAERVGGVTSAAQIVRLVRAAAHGETRAQNYAEQWADGFVAPTLGLAGGLYAASGDASRLLSMLLVDFGTGIRVAAPTTVLAAITSAARRGIVIKSGARLEKLDEVDTVVFDKTGTLTRGVPRLLDIVSFDERRFPGREILALAAAAEERVNHPVASAVVARARECNVPVADRTFSTYHVGMGVEVQVNGYRLHLGSERFLREQSIAIDPARAGIRQLNARGCSAMLFAVNGRLVGMLPYADTVRAESRHVIRTLHNRGVRQVVMLTGDGAEPAMAVGRELDVDLVVPGVLPEEKADVVRQLQAERGGVAMVGDGINDSPALAYADVGISMKNGADAALAASDVVLMDDNLWRLVTAFDVAHDAMRRIRQNFLITAGMNAVALALSIPSGLLSPALSALICNGSTIVASMNAVGPLL